jgi:hypothetical protein
MKMNKPLFLASAMLLIANTSNAEKRTIACKTPEIAASCYWTHGRLAVYNGSVNWRLWKIGTHNLLGIYSGPAAMPTRFDTLDSESPQLPKNLETIFERVQDPVYEISVYADFEVCPLEPHIPGHMQAACIESAKHLVIRK